MAGDQRRRAEGKEMSRITNGHGLCPRGSVCRVLPFPCPTACLQPCRAAARLRALVLDVCPGGPSGLHPLCPCVHQFSSPRRSLPRRNPLSDEYLLGVTAGREPGAPQAPPKGVSRRYPLCIVFLTKATCPPPQTTLLHQTRCLPAATPGRATSPCTTHRCLGQKATILSSEG